jgi:cytidyltransferase-like protein
VRAGVAEESLVCVTGRFQPVHDDHLRLFQVALAAGDRLVVAVTNPDPDTRHAEPTSDHRHRAEANPFTYYERIELLTAALAAADGLGAERAARVRIVPFDLGRPEHWSHYVPSHAVQYVGVYGPWEREKVARLVAGGYRTVEVHGDQRTRRTSSAIRSALRAGAGWEPLVPPATVQPLRTLLARRHAAGSPL